MSSPVPPPPARANSSAAVNSGTTLTSPSDSVQRAQKFFEALREFTNSPSYLATAELIDEVPRLRKLIAEKDKEVKGLTARLDEQKSEHDKIAAGIIHMHEQKYELHKEEKKEMGAKMKTLEAEMSAKIRNLEAEIEKYRENITQLHKSDEELTKQGRQARSLLEVEKEKHRNTAQALDELDKLVKRKDIKISELARNLKRAETEANRAGQSLRELEKERDTLARDLNETAEALTELEEFAEPLEDENWEACTGQLDALWRSATDLVASYFRKDLPDITLQNQHAWTELKRPTIFEHKIPLPRLNTAAAKAMRTAVILAILARLIDRHLFQPTFILGEESGLREHFVRQAIENSGKETFLRGAFLAAFPDEQAEIAHDNVTRIVTELMHHIHDLLPAAQVEGFRARLEEVVGQARDVWWRVQRLRQLLEPNWEFEDDEIGWDQPIKFEFTRGSTDGSGKKPEQQSAADQDNGAASSTAAAGIANGGPVASVVATAAAADKQELLIFPRIYIVEDDVPEPVMAGQALMRSQVEEAEREVLHQSSTANGSATTFGRAASHRIAAGGVGARAAPKARRLSVQMADTPTPDAPQQQRSNGGEASNFLSSAPA